MLSDFTMNLVIVIEETVGVVATWLKAHGMNVALIFLGAWLLHRYGAQVVTRFISHTVRADLYPTKTDREKRIKTLQSLSRAFIRFGVYLFAGALLLGEINPNYATAVFASAGLLTVALGFGAKDLINDFISGMFIIVENQYRVGDIVQIAGVSGVVEEVTVRTTILRDFDGNVHHVPNGDITVTTNKTLGFSRINEDIVLAADTDIEKVSSLINEVGTALAADPELKGMIRTAPHFSGVAGYAANGVVIKIAGKITAGDKWQVKSALYKALHVAFKKHRIQIAAPLVPPAPGAKQSKA